jgi:vacuolar iron transporter family protein
MAASSSNSEADVETPAQSAVSREAHEVRPASAPPPTKKIEHLGGHRQYWRDIILGVNDGLVSTFLLVMGVWGGGLSSKDILLTSISGALAGAISMCAGEYVATKSQNQVLSGEIQLETTHVQSYMDDELEELAAHLPKIGITDKEKILQESIIHFYGSNPESLLKFMIALEFGVLDEEIRAPWKAGVTSCGLFVLGSLPSVVPFAFIDSPSSAIIVAGVLTVMALMLVGAIKTWATRGNFISAAMENLVIAGAGGGLAYGVGKLIDNFVS